jgi:secreted trypsin-like serine protease
MKYEPPPIGLPFSLWVPGGFTNYLDWGYRKSKQNAPVLNPKNPLNQLALQARADEAKKNILVPAQCGRSRFATPLIIGGNSAHKGEFPWFGTLFITSNKEPKLLCGASLLSAKHVLTAAHCIERPNEPHMYTVLVGRHNIADGSEVNSQSRKVTKLEIHPDFYRVRRKTADADIALLKLQSFVQFNDFVQTICLPRASLNLSGVQGTVVGYGKSESPEEHTSTPRKISVRAVDLQSCLLNDGGYRDIASSRNFCAGGLGKTPCKGDSGGGFYVQDARSGEWALYGLVSEGIIVNGVCDAKKFVVYVDVVKFMAWIYGGGFLSALFSELFI